MTIDIPPGVSDGMELRVVDERMRVGKLAAGDQCEPVHLRARAFAVQRDAELVAGKARAERHGLRDVRRVFCDVYCARADVKSPCIFVLKLDVAQPGGRRHRDLGHRVREIGTLADRKILLDHGALRPILRHHEQARVRNSASLRRHVEHVHRETGDASGLLAEGEIEELENGKGKKK